MAIYTVHAPAGTRSTDVGAPERFVFVRDGFYPLAFVFGAFWIIAHRLWRVLLGYVSVQLVLYSALTLVGKTAALPFAYFGLALMLALEAGNLRRWTLQLKGAQEIGLVSADTREAAEQRFFDSWSNTRNAAGSSTTGPLAPTPLLATAGGPAGDIIGLFPHPGASR